MPNIFYQILCDPHTGWIHPAQDFGISGATQNGATPIRAIQINLDDQSLQAGIHVLYEVRINGQWSQGLRTEGNAAGDVNQAVTIDQIKVALANVNTLQVIYQVFSPGVGWLGNTGVNTLGSNGTVAGRPGRPITAIKIRIV